MFDAVCELFVRVAWWSAIVGKERAYLRDPRACALRRGELVRR
jgi:hypothetical protein